MDNILSTETFYTNNYISALNEVRGTLIFI
jgi:hypothetical protein